MSYIYRTKFSLSCPFQMPTKCSQSAGVNLQVFSRHLSFPSLLPCVRPAIRRSSTRTPHQEQAVCRQRQRPRRGERAEGWGVAGTGSMRSRGTAIPKSNCNPDHAFSHFAYRNHRQRGGSISIRGGNHQLSPYRLSISGPPSPTSIASASGTRVSLRSVPSRFATPFRRSCGDLCRLSVCAVAAALHFDFALLFPSPVITSLLRVRNLPGPRT